MATTALLDAICEAALNPAAWDRVQRESETYFGAFSSSLARADHRNGNTLLSRTTKVPEIDEAVREIAPFSEAVIYTAAKPRWRRLSDYDYIDEAGMNHSLFYRECERFDVRYRLGLRLVDSPGISQLILWFWPAAHGHAGPEEYAKLRLIEQELRLAAHVSDHLSQSLDVERGIVEALETTATPALVVEPNGTAIVMNGGAESALNQRDGLSLDGGRRLRADNRAAAARLADELASAGNAALLDRAQRCPCGVAIPRPSGRPAYSILVTPLPI